MSENKTADEFFEGHPFALSVYKRVESIVEALGPAEVRVSRSQVAFRRRRGFAYVWLPGRWLRKPAAEVVLSLALNRELTSPRFKEVVHPSRRVWMHHIELRSLGEVDAEVEAWMQEAFEGAS